MTDREFYQIVLVLLLAAAFVVSVIVIGGVQ